MVSFGDLSTDTGIKKLDQYLLTRSYISGYERPTLQGWEHPSD
jgi:hypothetical protein